MWVVKKKVTNLLEISQNSSRRNLQCGPGAAGPRLIPCAFYQLPVVLPTVGLPPAVWLMLAPLVQVITCASNSNTFTVGETWNDSYVVAVGESDTVALAPFVPATTPSLVMVFHRMTPLPLMQSPPSTTFDVPAGMVASVV